MKDGSEEEGLSGRLLLRAWNPLRSLRLLTSTPKAIGSGRSLPRYPGLYMFRAIMSIWVIAFHVVLNVIFTLPYSATQSLRSHLLIRLVSPGDLTVEAFFVLFGALSIRPFLRVCTTQRLGIDSIVLAFWYKVLRLWPSMIFPIILYGFVLGIWDASSWLSCANPLWFQTDLIAPKFSSHTWSLSVQMKGFILLLILILGANRTARRKGGSGIDYLRNTLVLAILIFTAVSIFVHLHFYILVPGQSTIGSLWAPSWGGIYSWDLVRETITVAPNLTSHSAVFVVYSPFYTRVAPVFVGALASIAIESKYHVAEKGMKRLCMYFVTYGVLIGVLALRILIPIPEELEGSEFVPQISSIWLRYFLLILSPLHRLLFSLSLSTLFYLSWKTPARKQDLVFFDWATVGVSKLGRVVFHFFAQISYGLYLVHPIAISMIVYSSSEMSKEIALRNSIVSVCFLFVKVLSLSVVLALLNFIFVESPIQFLVSRLLKPKMD